MHINVGLAGDAARGIPSRPERTTRDRLRRREDGLGIRRGRTRQIMLVLAGMLAAATASHGQPPPSLAPTGAEQAGPPQTISLDLKGVDILDVLKLLSQRTGFNFVAGHNVAGRVTIFANDIGVWEAFERIMEANDLAYERQGSVVSVMTAQEYEALYGQRFNARTQQRVVPLKFAKAGLLAPVINQVKSNIGQVVVDEASNTLILTDVMPRLEEMERLVGQLDRPTETRIYSLNYAEAEKLQEKIQEYLTPGIGTFNFDARTNKVIVSDLTGPIEKIDRIIRALDERDGDVLIEAKIVKVDLNDTKSFGIDWQQVFAGVDTKSRMNFRVLSDIVDPAAGSTAATGAALKFLSAPRGDTQIILEALQTIGNVETISNPRIAVSDNQEARILIGTKQAFVTVTTTVPASGSVVTSPEIQFVDVGTKLFVTPRIARDGHIRLKIRPEVSTATIETFQTNRIPIVSTTEAETNVIVKSGTTLVIGGLIDSKNEESRSQVPILGDIPFIGAAFRSRVDTKKKTELVVFLTPQIISASGQHITQFPASDAIVERDASRGEAALSEREALLPVSYQTSIRQILYVRLAEQLRLMGAGAGSMELSFVLNRDGQLVGEPQATSPSGEPFIRAARAALEAALPFPPFPPGFTDSETIRFRIPVDYRP